MFGFNLTIEQPNALPFFQECANGSNHSPTPAKKSSNKRKSPHAEEDLEIVSNESEVIKPFKKRKSFEQLKEVEVTKNGSDSLPSAIAKKPSKARKSPVKRVKRVKQTEIDDDESGLSSPSTFIKKYPRRGKSPSHRVDYHETTSSSISDSPSTPVKKGRKAKTSPRNIQRRRKRGAS